MSDERRVGPLLAIFASAAVGAAMWAGIIYTAWRLFR